MSEKKNVTQEQPKQPYDKPRVAKLVKVKTGITAGLGYPVTIKP